MKKFTKHSMASALASMDIDCVRYVLQEQQAVILGLAPEEQLQITGSSFSKRFIRIKPSVVPAYLHSSELYKSLDLETDDEFEVPILNYKLDLSIHSTPDLALLLDTLDYWGSEQIFPEVLSFIYRTYKVQTALATEPLFVHQNYAQRWTYVRTLLRIAPKKQRDSQMMMALQSGILELVIFLREQGIQLDDMSMQYAIRSQNPDCIRYVQENKDFILPAPDLFFPRRIPFSPAQPCDIATLKHYISARITDVLTVECCMIAAKAGDLDVLQQLHELGCPWDVTCCTEAAAHGHLYCLKYAHEQGAPWNMGTCAAAARNKRVECLTYLVENGCPADGAVSRAAIANGDLEMLMFAHENLLPWEDDMCMLAASAGSLPCLKYVHEAGCELTSETCAAARLECLKYAHENGAPWTVSTAVAAAKSYDLPRLEYAHQNGCPIDKSVCAAAIKSNCNMLMVRYMGENRFPFDANHARQAAKQGSDNLLKFLHIYGCPWTSTTTRDAAAGGHIDALKYAAERGCPVHPITCSFGQHCDEESPHFECMKYIFDHHDSTFDSVAAITRDHFACFCYAHDHGAPWSEDILVTAARMGRLKYLQYAFERGGCPYHKYIRRVYDAALQNEHVECVEYIDELREIKEKEEDQRRIRQNIRMLQRRRRRNGRMIIRKVFVENVFTAQQITYYCRLPANRQFVNDDEDAESYISDYFESD